MNTKEKALTHDRLLQLLEYNERTGLFTWRENMGRCFYKGKVAGSKFRYTYIQIDRRKYTAHRLAWFYVYKEWPYPMIDHIDRDRYNNCIDNLRVVTAKENSNNYIPQKIRASA